MPNPPHYYKHKYFKLEASRKRARFEGRNREMKYTDHNPGIETDDSSGYTYHQ
jgi:hypothetical protein